VIIRLGHVAARRLGMREASVDGVRHLAQGFAARFLAGRSPFGRPPGDSIAFGFCGQLWNSRLLGVPITGRAQGPGVNAHVFANLYRVARRVAASPLRVATALSIIAVWRWRRVPAVKREGRETRRPWNAKDGKREGRQTRRTANAKDGGHRGTPSCARRAWCG